MVTNGLLLHCTPHATAFVNTDAADTPTEQTVDLSTSPLRKPVCWESTCGWEMFEWIQMKGNAQRGTKLRPVLAALPVSAMAFQLSNQQQGGTSRAWHLLRRPRAFAVCSPRLTLKKIKYSPIFNLLFYPDSCSVTRSNMFLYVRERDCDIITVTGANAQWWRYRWAVTQVLTVCSRYREQAGGLTARGSPVPVCADKHQHGNYSNQLPWQFKWTNKHKIKITHEHFK